jgi:hypothetical protein
MRSDMHSRFTSSLHVGLISRRSPRQAQTPIKPLTTVDVLATECMNPCDNNESGVFDSSLIKLMRGGTWVQWVEDGADQAKTSRITLSGLVPPDHGFDRYIRSGLLGTFSFGDSVVRERFWHS